MSAAPSPSLRNLFSELEQLFQTETQALVSSSVEAAERVLSENLNQAVRRLRQAQGFADVAVVLCDASAPFAGACAVFRVENDAVILERARGAEQIKDLRFPASGAAAFAG